MRCPQRLQIGLRQSFEIPPVFTLAQLPGESKKALAIDIAHIIGYLLDAGDSQTLPHLYRTYELGRLEQGFVSTGVEPGAAAAEPLDGQQLAVEIDVVEVGDLELAACRGFKPGRDLDNCVVVKIQPSDRPLRTRVLRLFLDTDRCATCIEFDDAIGLG